jgi:hypothetical protein
MWLRLRQICLVAADIDAVTGQFERVFDLRVCYVDPGVGRWGLENRLLPVGNQLLEIVSPVRHGTAAGRYLDKRGGDGGYMVITQCDDIELRRARIEALGVRVANALQYDDYNGMQLHPRDTGGAFFEIDQQLTDNAPDGDWHPAGPRWRDYRRTSIIDGIDAAELQSPEPRKLAKRWSDIAQLSVASDAGAHEMALENAALRFVDAQDLRGEGLSALYLHAVDRDAALERASAEGVLGADQVIEICGMRLYV